MTTERDIDSRIIPAAQEKHASFGSLLRRHRQFLFIAVLLTAAILLRLDGITRPSVATRELYGALVARQYYVDYFGGGLSPPKRQVVRELRDTFEPIEPPVLNVASAAVFRLTGGENLWVPRLLSALLWVIGGVFLFSIGRRVTTSAGAVVALGLYLFWPFGVWISRRGMPDAMMVSLLLAASLTVIRYWESPSRRRLLVAGVVSSLAGAAKPGVALIFLAVLFVALAISQRALFVSLLRGRLPLFIALASTLSIAYYVYGTYFRHFLSGQTTGRVTPREIAEGRFWRGWWSMISDALSFPLEQRTLALVPIIAALTGIAVARRGIPRTVLIGLSLGYVAFGLVFTQHISTHSYYSLPLIAIFSLSIGSLAGYLLAGLPPSARSVLVGLLVVVIGGAIYADDRKLRSENPRQLILDYRRIGQVTRHSTQALVVDGLENPPISYWGWMVARYWYDPTPAQDLAPPATRVHTKTGLNKFSFLIVIDVNELRTERRLRALTRTLPIVARTNRYSIFDLRSHRLRAITPAGSPAN
jgi:4-amino-4-deoxy-L-arabinose transferase-like glycosyltransferase